MKRILKVLLAGFIAGVSVSHSPLARAESGANFIPLMNIQFKMGLLSGSVPLKAELNTRDFRTIEYIMLDMPWVFEKLGAADRYFAASRFMEGELIVPSMTDFDGDSIRVIALQSIGGFDLQKGGNVNFIFKASKSNGGGCRVASLSLRKNGTLRGYSNFGISRLGIQNWLTDLEVSVESESDGYAVKKVTLTEGGLKYNLPLNSLPLGACP